MLAHIVLFRPRGDLNDADRDALIEALTKAFDEIPSIRRARIGRRVTHGRPYEQLMRTDYPYLALLEFDNLSGLQSYLAHPTHEQLATRFFAAFEEALMYDYDMADLTRSALPSG